MTQRDLLSATMPNVPLDLDGLIKAYEAARAADSEVQLIDFLPRVEHPLYMDVLRELVRVDLEYAWQEGRAKRLEEYAIDFPEFFRDRRALGETAFEEYRLRRQAGEKPSPKDYARRFDIDTSGWPEDSADANVAAGAALPVTIPEAHHDAPGVRPAAERPSSKGNRSGVACRSFLKCPEQTLVRLDLWNAAHADQRQYVDFLRNVHDSDPASAARLAESLATLPAVGSSFLGFHLLEELGRGAFGTVYLAEQGDLANRPVALKVAADIRGESRTLAQLQHTNIVPIHSVHRAELLQAVCMPYIGRTTLADVLRQLDGGRSLPASGKVLISTLNDRKASTRGPQSKKAGSAGSAAPESAEPAAAPGALAHDGDNALLLKQLESMSYVNAVLWMGARLADGLAHAHERGILHRDLKPANILLTDDGQPMLLDFNLSEDTKLRGSAVAASIGGTLPYMAPEHLRAFLGGSRQLDARSDIYSLGVILYELLTGQRPCQTFVGTSPEVLDQMIRERYRPLAPLEERNPAVTPAAIAILRRCLAAEPADRYQSARELHEDLDRQLHDLPLRHIPEPSLRERARKFARRYPRLTSVTSVAIVAVVFCVILTSAFALQALHMRRLEAREKLGEFKQQATRAHHILYARTQSKDELKEGVNLCRAALERYEVIENARWRELAAFTNLSRTEQEKLEEDVGELLFLLARGTEREASDHPESAKRQDQLQLALSFNELAETRSHGLLASAPLWKQRAELATVLGKNELAERLAEKVKKTPALSTRDLYLTAHGHAIDSNFRAAMPLLETVTRRDPQNYSAWAVLGNCHDALCQDADALACYSVCIALRPDDQHAWHNRGLIYLKQRLFDSARADFTEAIHLSHDFADAFIDRALALEGLNKYHAAIEDLSAALKLGTPRTRVYFMRALAREKLGDADGAKCDNQEGLRLEPSDDPSWIARGLARQARDPKGALADFDTALALNPRSVDALQNKASVLSECLGQREEALRVLDRAVALFPDFVPARAGRGVLLARAGKREAAEADARESLLRDTRAPNLYQVACVYALNAKQNPEARVHALNLLSQALRQGFGLDVVDQDSDLDPIRNDPEFRRVVIAAKELQKEISAH